MDTSGATGDITADDRAFACRRFASPRRFALNSNIMAHALKTPIACSTSLETARDHLCESEDDEDDEDDAVDVDEDDDDVDDDEDDVVDDDDNVVVDVDDDEDHFE